MSPDEFTALLKAATIKLEFAVVETIMDLGVKGDRISRDHADELLAEWAAIAECRVIELGVRS